MKICVIGTGYVGLVAGTCLEALCRRVQQIVCGEHGGTHRNDETHGKQQRIYCAAARMAPRV